MSITSLKNKGTPFLSGSIPRAMLIFSGPFILGILVQNLYGAVDLFVVGHYAATADVSAVTIGSQLMSIVTQLIIGFATGITVLVGQYCGAQDEKKLTRIVGTAAMLFGVAAFLLCALYLGLHRHLALLMRTPPEALAETNQYLFYCSLGIVFIVGYNVISSILTGLGDSKTPFLFIMLACLINVALDVLLVKYAGLGARGAAIATTVAQAGSFFFAFFFLKSRGLGFPFSRADLRLDRAQLRNIALIGGPVALQNVLVSASFLFITAIINLMGVVASAAVGVVEKLITFLFVPAVAMGTAVGTASAQNLGAHRPDRARKALWWGILLALLPAVAITIYCQFFSERIVGILTADPQVVTLAADYLRSYVCDILLVSFVFCMNGFFNSCGKSWFSLLHSLATTFAVRIPLAYFLSRLEGASMFYIGWSAPVSTLVSLVMCVVFLRYTEAKEKIPAPDIPPERADSGTPRFVVAISREYGSGGRLIGEEVAKKLGVSFYNRNLIDLTAKRIGLAENYITDWKEQISSRFIWSGPSAGRGIGTPWFSTYYSNTDIMFHTQSQIIRELAEKESCVIVGRCADYVLRGNPNCVNVFIRADEAHKLQRLVGEYGVDGEKAAETAKTTDRGRADYYRRYTGGTWGDAKQYHLVIDSGMFGIEGSADVIADSVRKIYPAA